MDNQQERIKAFEKMLDMLPETLTEDEKKKVEEIRKLLNKLYEKTERQSDKDNSMERQVLYVSPRYMEALSEVDYVINNLEREEIEKIPIKFREFIMKNKSKSYA